MVEIIKGLMMGWRGRKEECWKDYKEEGINDGIVRREGWMME